MKPGKPNLFWYATSELSQDAMLCWLLSWADDKHRGDNGALHAVAVDFLNSIYEEAKKKAPAKCQSIEIRRQECGIDILCIVNGETAIVIEDKVGTKQHSYQLLRYKKYVEELRFSPDKILPVYVQTGDQGDYHEVVRYGYVVYDRQDLLKVLEGEPGVAAARKSDILSSYARYLREIEDDVQSFQRLPQKDWSWGSWKGFYSKLQKALADGGWAYVANPAGGFLGFWWHFLSDDECEQYLEIEQGKLCFKIAVEDREKRVPLRDLWHEKILKECARLGVNAERPNQFGNGTYMTVAVFAGEFPVAGSDQLLDFPKTVELLRKAERVLDAASTGTGLAPERFRS
jgi:hypothetical protein